MAVLKHPIRAAYDPGWIGKWDSDPEAVRGRGEPRSMVVCPGDREPLILYTVEGDKVHTHEIRNKAGF